MDWLDKIEIVGNSGNMGDALELLHEMEQELFFHADDIKFLRALEAAGVDNWQGYEFAVDIYNGKEED